MFSDTLAIKLLSRDIPSVYSEMYPLYTNQTKARFHASGRRLNTLYETLPRIWIWPEKDVSGFFEQTPPSIGAFSPHFFSPVLREARSADSEPARIGETVTLH